MPRKSVFLTLFVFLLCVSVAVGQDWMPDENLREVVSEQLSIENFTQDDMMHLSHLAAIGRNIFDLKGLEHAENLVFLNLGGNQISDLQPLTELIHLEVLHLWGNNIKEVVHLAGLVNLKELVLSTNPISDISPLSRLENLENLEIHNTNTKGVFSTLPTSKLMQFGYDETCNLEGLSISERIKNREYPSIFSVFGNIINLPELSYQERLSYHDLHWSGSLFHIEWLPSPEGLKTLLHVDSAKEYRDDMLLNS